MRVRSCDVLLMPSTFDVLKRMPVNWMDSDVVKSEIAQATGRSPRDVANRIGHLLKHGLIEARMSQAIAGRPEYRRTPEE